MSWLANTDPEITTVFEVVILLKNKYCANAQTPACILCAHTHAVKTGALQTCTNHRESQKRNHQAQKHTKISANIFICHQVVLHNFTRHFSLCFQASHGEISKSQTLLCFRYFLKATWAIEFKDKVKAKSIPIMYLLGFAGYFKALRQMINVLQH